MVPGRDTHRGTKNQPLEKIAKAFLSWNVERDSGGNHCQQESRNKPDVAPAMQVLIPTKSSCLTQNACLSPAPAEKQRGELACEAFSFPVTVVFNCCLFVRTIYDDLC